MINWCDRLSILALAMHLLEEHLVAADEVTDRDVDLRHAEPSRVYGQARWLPREALAPTPVWGDGKSSGKGEVKDG